MNELVKKRKEEVSWLADHYGWTLFEFQTDQLNLRFRKGSYVVNVWLTKLTVAVVFKGKQFFHKKLSQIEVEKILMNPQNFLKDQYEQE